MEQCSTCKYHKFSQRTMKHIRFDDGMISMPVQTSECRIGPPSENGWPEVRPEDWCGEWEDPNECEVCMISEENVE